MANNRGKKFDQKMKPFLVYQYLIHNSDENNVVKAERAEVFLTSALRHSAPVA